MSRIAGASIISEVRLNNNQLRRDAAQTKGILRNLVRGIGTSSGPDPVVNAIGRIAPAAAGALAAVKALSLGLEFYNNSKASAAARARGDIEEEVRLAKELNDVYRNFPVVGGVGNEIREAIIGKMSEGFKKGLRDVPILNRLGTSEADIRALNFENAQQQKLVDFEQKKADAKEKARKESEEIVRETAREISMLNKSPRVKEIMQALHALEDYRREAQKIADEANAGKLTEPQQGAIKALEGRIEALRKKRGPAAFSEAVAAAQAAQVAILEAEQGGAQKRVDIAKKEAADKKKAAEQGPGGKVDYRAEAQKRLDRVQSEIEETERFGNSGPRLRRLRAEERQLKDVKRFGSTTEGGTRRQERAILEADKRQRASETRAMKERQERERSQATELLRKDPDNALLRKTTEENLSRLEKKQAAERASLAREQELRSERAERRTGNIRRVREPVRKAEEERRSTPLDRVRMQLREGYRALFGMGDGDAAKAPRAGDAGSDAVKKLGTAGDKLEKAADKLSKMQTVGVIRR